MLTMTKIVIVKLICFFFNYIAIMAIAIFNNSISVVLANTDTIIENNTSHNSNIIKKTKLLSILIIIIIKIIMIVPILLTVMIIMFVTSKNAIINLQTNNSTTGHYPGDRLLII